MRWLSVAMLVGVLVLGTATFTLAASVSVDVYPLYVAKDGGTGTTGTPFAIFVRISGWTEQADQDAYIRVHEAVGLWSNYYHWTADNTWSRTAGYSTANYNILHINGSGDTSGWIFLKYPSDKTFTTFTVRANVGGSGGSNLDLGVNKSITPMDMSTAGAWIYATATSATAGKAVLAFDGGDSIIGAYAIEDNSVVEGYSPTAGYFKIAVPENTSIAKLQARNADNSIYDTQTSSNWSSGDPGTETNLDEQEDVSLPITLSSFTALPGDGQVILRWITESEIDNLGFNVYRSLEEDGEYMKINGDLIQGAGSSTGRSEYSFTDVRLTNGQTYFYKLEDVSFDGKHTLHGPIKAIPKAVVKGEEDTSGEKEWWRKHSRWGKVKYFLKLREEKNE